MWRKRRAELIALAVMLAALGGMSVLFIGSHADRSFITYRYARSLSEGQGFVYNPGEPVLSEAVAPLYAVLLALGSALLPDLPLLGNLLGIAGMALSTLALFGLAYPSGRLAAAGMALLLLLYPPLWLALGLETTLWLGLCLLAVWLHTREHPAPAAVLLALATLMRPEAALLGLALLAFGLASGRPFRVMPVALYLGLAALGAAWLGRLFESGGPLPGLPAAPALPLPPEIIGGDLWDGLRAYSRSLLALSPLWAAVILLAAAGVVHLVHQRRAADRWAIVLAVWAALHLAAWGLLGAAVTPMSLAPLVPAVIGLAGLGAVWLAERVEPGTGRWALGGLAALLAAGAAGESLLRLALTPVRPAEWSALSPAPVETGWVEAASWLLHNTPAGTRTGATRTGVLGYIAGRPMLDYYGAFQPDIADSRRRGDTLWWVNAYLPDALVLRESEWPLISGAQENGGVPDPWFTALYAEAARFGPPGADPVIILIRTAAPPPLNGQLVGMVTYPEGLVLNNIAVDFSLDPLAAGSMGRLRIEWLLNQPIGGPRHVSIAVESRDGLIAAWAERDIHFERWPQRRLITTYHALSVLPNLPPGVYNLVVSVGPPGGAATSQIITTAKVPFPEAAFVGAVSGSRADFGDLSLLGYRLSSGPDTNLEVLLLWQALRIPQADYQVFVQIRDTTGLIAAQVVSEPLSGDYPTSYWSAGEQITDSYPIAVDGLVPGTYQVYAGLLAPDGSRLLTTDGRDAVFVGGLTIGE
jgi:hypothetical protein